VAAGKHVPLRKCAGCGQMKEKKQMIRIIRTETGTVEFDPTGRRNGRGAYLCRDKNCFTDAVKKKALQRSLKCSIDNELIQLLEKEIEKDL